MRDSKGGNKPLTQDESQSGSEVPLTAATVRALVEELLRQHTTAPKSEIIGFDEVVARLPLSARSLRSEIHKGRIPHIRLPGARRLLFDWPAVLRSLNRFSHGVVED